MYTQGNRTQRTKDGLECVEEFYKIPVITSMTQNERYPYAMERAALCPLPTGVWGQRISLSRMVFYQRTQAV